MEKPRMQVKYEKEVRKSLADKFKYKNLMQIPRITKVVLNIGVGDATKDYKLLEMAVADLQTITGRKPRINRSKKAIANFKLRENLPIGTSVTLRRYIMWEFIDRFVSVASPRIKDFKGFSPNKFDGRGNYNISLREQFIFPEIDMDKVQTIRGMNITFTTTAKTDEEAKHLLSELGFPFSKK